MKMIILTILLSLIASSLSFHVSSNKRRYSASVSAYLHATNNLGYRNGYKNLAPKSLPGGYFYYFDISYNKKEIISPYVKNPGYNQYLQMSEKAVSNNFIKSINSVPELEKDSNFAPIRDSITCREDQLIKLCLNLLRIKSFSHSSNEPYKYNIIYIDNQNKEIAFDLVIKNYNTAEQATSKEINLVRASNFLYTVKGGITEVLRAYRTLTIEIAATINTLKSTIDYRLSYLSGKSNLESLNAAIQKADIIYNECFKRYNDGEARKNALNIEIGKLKAEKSGLEQKKDSCEKEVEFMTQKIMNLQIYIKNKKDEIALWIKENEESKADAIKRILYWSDAAFYYRVFNKKLLNNLEEVKTGFSNDKIKETCTKIQRAFLPLPTDLSFLSKKLRRL